jgi:hypothetical protein
MRNFLKHNFLILLVLFFGYAALTLAGTYVRPYGTSDYAGGQKAVGPKVNAEFAGITAFLNGGNLGSTNLSAQGVATSNIADAAVTVAKLGAGNLVVTDSSSNYQATGSVTPFSVTNLSTTITTTGRNVLVSLEPYPGTYLNGGSATFGSFVRQFSSPSGTSSALFFVRDSTTTGYFFLSNIVGAATISDMRNQCSDFHYHETNLAAGTYTFTVKVGLAAVTDSVFVNNCRLVVKEEL